MPASVGRSPPALRVDRRTVPSVTPEAAAVVAAAGLAAGAVNTVAGGGSLISFPALLAVGFAPLPANVTNTVGLVSGYFGGTVAYRRELAGQGRRARLVCGAALAGALAGAVILLTTPASVFEAVVPFLVLGACALLAAQPRLSRWLRRRDRGAQRERVGALIAAAVAGGAYGAYFGAALGVMMLAVLGLFVPDRLQRLNALKGLMSLAVSVLAAAIYAVFAPVSWSAAAVLAGSSLVGGHLGGALARRLSDRLLRAVVVVFGVAVAVRLLAS